MTLIVTCHTQEGIVMASDSRLTIDFTYLDGKVDKSISQSDSIFKTFNLPNNIATSYFGQATINGIPISGFVQKFIDEKTLDTDLTVTEVANLLNMFFQNTPETPDTGFHVAGYIKENGEFIQYIYRVFPKANSIINIAPTQQQHGVIWDGEQDILIRTINPNIYFNNGTANEKLACYDIPFQMFTLQDAIDFCNFAIKITADTMRFQLRYKTVGGPIDILVIKPNESYWITKKTLHI